MGKTNLSTDQLKFWKENSYLVFKGLLADQIGEVSGWVDEILQWPEDMSKWMTFYEMNDPEKVSRVENFVPYHKGVGSTLLNEELRGTVSQLMGEEAILYKDRINFKPSGGGAHSAHQDGVAYESGALAEFDKETSPYISILVGIDGADSHNGCFEVVSNWPLSNYSILPMENPDPEHPNFSKITQKAEDSLDWIQIDTDPGDVILFTERLPHRSGTNNSNDRRRILYGVFNPISEGDKREKYYEDKRKNLNDARYMIGNPHAPS